MSFLKLYLNFESESFKLDSVLSSRYDFSKSVLRISFKTDYSNESFFMALYRRKMSEKSGLHVSQMLIVNFR